MPIGVFKSVREVSSEDAVHVAANLLQQNAAKKWKTKAVGEKSAYVILEFEEAQQITGIDIGNEHAAFIEVLVSNSGCQPDDFKELLLSSSFMTPIESKNSSNLNRVRCFSGDALNTITLPDKWKLLKIVCTQPFNKHVQYGLSFIKAHVTGTAKPKTLVPSNPVVGFAFKLRADSTDSEPDGKGSLALFKRWKATRNEDDNKPAVSTAAAIRDAASPAALRQRSEAREKKDQHAHATAPSPAAKRTSVSKNPPCTPSPRVIAPKRISSSPEVTPFKPAKKAKTFNDELPKDKDPTTSKHPAKESPRTSLVPTPKRISLTTEATAKPQKSHSIEKPIKYVEFNQLLRGVVLVISGIQNPDRADLRSMAIALGAKYKADWESGCTHLICAFRNTPKYNQVKGKGKIVTRSWIEKCYALKKYLPWRRYALDTNEAGQVESDEELVDASLKSKYAAPDDINMLNVTDEKPNFEDMQQQGYSSGPDTEDELERVAQQNKVRKCADDTKQSAKENKLSDSNKSNVEDKKSRDVYEVSTDEEDYLQDI